MQIYECLKKDHVKVLGLLDKLIEAGQRDEDSWRDLVAEIRNELIPHARAEEAVFYNSLREIDTGKRLALEGYGEHAVAEGLLRTLQATSFLDIKWVEVAKKLQKALKDHIAEEEGVMFNAARGLFLDKEAEMMAEAFERLKPQIRDENMAQSTLEMVANLMPERLRKVVRKFTPTGVQH